MDVNNISFLMNEFQSISKNEVNYKSNASKKIEDDLKDLSTGILNSLFIVNSPPIPISKERSKPNSSDLKKIQFKRCKFCQSNLEKDRFRKCNLCDIIYCDNCQKNIDNENNFSLNSKFICLFCSKKE